MSACPYIYAVDYNTTAPPNKGTQRTLKQRTLKKRTLKQRTLKSATGAPVRRRG